MPLFADRWNTAKAQFEAMTLRKKPREKVGKIFKTAHTGLSKSLEKCDQTDAAFDVEGFRNMLALRAEIETGGGAAPPAEKYVDLSYYRRAMSALDK